VSRRPNLADLMLERMADGRAHDDAMLVLTSSVEQVRGQVAGEPWDSDLYLAQAEVLASGQDVEALARCAAMALTLASTSATLIAALAEGLGYDVDGLLAGMAQVRPPYPA
jgi:hypothetical protein